MKRETRVPYLDAVVIDKGSLQTITVYEILYSFVRNSLQSTTTR